MDPTLAQILTYLFDLERRLQETQAELERLRSTEPNEPA